MATSCTTKIPALFGLCSRRAWRFNNSCRSKLLHTSFAFCKEDKHMHHPNWLDKRLLVWVKRYKSVDEVPSEIKYKVIVTARDRARVKTMWYAIFFFVSACGVMMFLGKSARERGESVEKSNLDWHKEYNEAEEKSK